MSSQYTVPTPTTAAPSGAAGGDLTGTYPNPTVKASVTLTGHPTIEGVTATGATGTGKVVFDTTPTFTTNITTPLLTNSAAVSVTTGANGNITLTPNGTGIISLGKAEIAPNNSLTDNGTTIATDASLGNNFRITALTANVTLSNPTNPTDGQVVTWEVIQNASAAKTLAFGAAFAFGTEITACTISAGLSSHSFLTAIYNSTTTKWYVRGCITGY